MNSRSLSRRWMVLVLAVGLVLLGVAPAASARKATDGWESVDFTGDFLFYEATLVPGSGEELVVLHIQAYDGEFKLGKRTTRTASVVVVQAGGGDCIADDGRYNTETGYVIVGWQLIGADEVGEAVYFETPRDGELNVSLPMAGTRFVWEAEHLGPGHCNGIAVIDEQSIAKTIDLALSWSSTETVISVPKGKSGKSTEETRWRTTIDNASGSFDGVGLGLPFGPWDPSNEPVSYVAQSLSFSRSVSITIPTGTFD